MAGSLRLRSVACLVVVISLFTLVHAVKDSQAYALSSQSQRSADKPEPHDLISVLRRITHLNYDLASQGEVSSGSNFERAYSTLFPFTSPALNSILATFYISSLPNFFLVLVPENLDLQSLNTMVSFATGGLLGDVFIHLLPEIFLPHNEIDSSEHAPHVIIVEPHRNVILGGFIFCGFAGFFILEKLFRILSSEGDSREGHSHSHSHSHSIQDKGHSSSVSMSPEKEKNIRKRKGKENNKIVDVDSKDEDVTNKSSEASTQLSAYLNLIADATHNVTDGLAMSAAFYTSPSIGATTTLAVFAHEIPHEVADYSILVKSGFSKRRALASQFLTSVGAFLGTIIGIIIQESSLQDSSKEEGNLTLVTEILDSIRGNASGIGGTTLTAGDLVVPFVAGGFLYIATVGVVPGLVEDSKNWKKGGAVQMVKELVSMGVGLSLMFWIAWQDS